MKLRRILITNDDGDGAPGLLLLAEAAAAFAEEIWVVAPLRDCSGTTLSLTITRPVGLHQRGARHFALDGHPADCVLIALRELLADQPPDLVLSGVNSGSNLAYEQNLSGTAGAALMAVLMGYPAIALSQQYSGRRTAIDWQNSRRALPLLLAYFLEHGWPKSTALSINLPATPLSAMEFVWCPPDTSTRPTLHTERRQDLREQTYFVSSVGEPQGTPTAGSDVAMLHQGLITVSALGLYRTSPSRVGRVALAAT